jgi:hypothetical protein
MDNGRLSEIAERNARIVDAYRAGRTLGAIGVQYGMSHERIRQIVRELDPGLLRRVGPKQILLAERKKRAVALARTGATISVIVRQARLPTKTVYAACAEAGVTIRNLGGTSARWTRAHVMLGLGWNYGRIVAETGVDLASLKALASTLRAEGLPLRDWRTRAGRVEKARQKKADAGA